jgi:glycosyltransferase involved in cell wall biosynthesis
MEVTAYIVTKNRSHLLKRSILSVINQTYPVSELIVIDDCSNDNTKDIVSELIKKYPIISYYRLYEPSGACVARNAAINKAKFKYIAGLDDDDEWNPFRIEYFLNYYKPNHAFITSRNKIIVKSKVNRTTYSPKKIRYKDMLSTNFAGNQIFTETYKLKEIGGFDENLVAAQDYDTFLRLCEKFGSGRCLKKTLQNVYQDNELNRITDKAKLGYINFYFKHIDKFNKKNKISQIFRIKQITDSKLKLSYLFFAPNIYIFLKMFKYILIKRLHEIKYKVKKIS